MEGYDLSVLESKEKVTVLAYSMSKMTIVDELKEFKKYNEMMMCEFYEFICRWSELIYKDLKIPLVEKISKLLPILFNTIKAEFKPLTGDQGIESDSDYNDDIVDSVM